MYFVCLSALVMGIIHFILDNSCCNFNFIVLSVLVGVSVFFLANLWWLCFFYGVAYNRPGPANRPTTRLLDPPAKSPGQPNCQPSRVSILLHVFALSSPFVMRKQLSSNLLLFLTCRRFLLFFCCLWSSVRIRLGESRQAWATFQFPFFFFGK